MAAVAVAALCACDRVNTDKPTTASIEPIVTARPSPQPAAVAPASPRQAAPTARSAPGYQFTYLQMILLDQVGYRLVQNDACAQHVDLTLSVYQSTSVAPAVRAARVHEALTKGYWAGCFVPKTSVDLMPSRVRDYWSGNRIRVIQSKECTPYIAAVDAVAVSAIPEAERIYQLTKTFDDAATRGCMRTQNTGQAAR